MNLLHCAVIFSICLSASAITNPNSTHVKNQKIDTYLEAYSKSRIDAEKAKQSVVIVTAKDGEKKITNRDDSYNGYDYSPPDSSFSSASSGYPASSAPSSYLPPGSYGPPIKFESDITYNSPPNTYGPPAHTYGPPAQNYGPPAQTYGPPAHNYGPPSQSYGPPANFYGPPMQKPVYGPPSNGIPYFAPGFNLLDKLALKLDILTMAKLFLKFLIFKKIVTMIAVVCMLLVIPKLISFKKDDSGSASGGNDNNNEDDDEGFMRKHGRVIELTSIQQMVERAIAVYNRQQPDCGLMCRMGNVIEDFYHFQPYFREDAFRSTPTNTR